MHARDHHGKEQGKGANTVNSQKKKHQPNNAPQTRETIYRGKYFFYYSDWSTGKAGAEGLSFCPTSKTNWFGLDLTQFICRLKLAIWFIDKQEVKNVDDGKNPNVDFNLGDFGLFV